MMQIEAFSQQFFFHHQGLGSTEAWELAEVGFVWTLEQRGNQQWWREWERVFPLEFRAYVDGQLEEILAEEPDRED